MISVKINGLTVTLTGNPTLERNVKEEYDTGKIVIVSTKALRYEMYDTVDITTPYKTEQYLVQSDSKPKLNATEYEHTLTLMENLAALDVIYPADRSFKVIGQTLGDILAVYKRELDQYHNTTITYATMGATLNETIPFKEFAGLNMSTILLSLFRKIWAVPKVTRNGTELDIYPLYHNQKNNLISEDSISVIEQQNNIDYATRIKSQLKNAVNERGIAGTSWFPSESGYVLPRSSSLIKITSKLRYELDSDIVSILKGIAVEVPIVVVLTSTGNDVVINANIDITDQIVQDEVWDLLSTGTIVNTNNTSNVRNHIKYKVGDKYITNLYESATDKIIFDIATPFLINAIKRELILNPTDYYDDSIYSGTPVLNPTGYDTEDVKMRFKYIKRRNIDLIHQRKTKGSMNESTAIHQQRDSSVEINEYKKNLDLYANRMGNAEKSKTKIFTGVEPYQLFDYTDDKTIVTRVQNTYHNTFTYCEYEESENFSNIEAEYALMRRSDPYTINAKSVTTNLISQEFIEFSEINRPLDTILEDSSRRMLLGMFEATTIPYDKVSVGVFKPVLASWNSDYAISMPVEASGDANSITLHVQFTHQNIAGKTFYNLDTDALTSYLNPLPYTDVDGDLEDFNLYFAPDILFEDTGEYPLILVETNYLANKLTTSGIVWPLDLDNSASFAFTFEISVISPDNIYIGNALSTENYFIKDQATTTAIKIYSSTKPYSSYDQAPRSTDTDITATAGYTYSFANRNITFAPSIALEYFCVVKDDKILLAFNRAVASDATYVIYINHINENIDIIKLDLEYLVTATNTFVYIQALNQKADISIASVYATSEVTSEIGKFNYAADIELDAIYATSELISAIDKFNYAADIELGQVAATSSIEYEQGLDYGVSISIASVYATSSIEYIKVVDYEVAIALDNVYATSSITYLQDFPNKVATPTFYDNSSITTTTANVLYKNEDASTARIYITVNGVEKSVLVNSGSIGYQSFSGLTPNTNYNSSAYAIVSGKDDSEIATGTSFTTDEVFTITYDANGGTGGTTEDFDEGTSASTVSANKPSVSRTGYTLTGWTPTWVTVTADKTYTAQWSVITYQATFTGLTGATPSGYLAQTIDYGESASSPGIPTKSGYTFTGWTPSFVALYANQEYTANWAANTYTITFNANGGTTPSPTSKSVTYDSTYGTLATTTRSGYTLDGWFTATSGGTEITSSSTVSIAGNDTLYAQWTLIPEQTATPSITDSLYNSGTFKIEWKVLNNDDSTATLYSDVGDDTPTLNVDTDIASGSKGILHNKTSLGGGTIYAKAQASGETLSEYTSQYEG